MHLAGDDRFRTVRELFGTASDTKYSGLVLKRGDRVAIRSAGGGGYGLPADRDAESVAEDVAQGFISAAAARADYEYERNLGSQ